ncbi:bacillithiol biosynthesis cysteine-adding enzyme BshC [Anoxybacter fermentans]|uniref:Putative cysteine ligase BshC n=1 Tax=Anoxybacter fermentans TaxID=1323375 RepID=A0A3S9SYH4_9FIRM|nr:bacillithiol biosynthesis cysteine-adding enzyme BshC [Anoxybacter fermentans]AZR73212.1 bacillithiol biosynthesis cysteine-adding enzyme BshC [Anoxybacter fermentans]
MKVEEIRISERPLIDDYRYNFKKVKEFFQYNPHNPFSFDQRYQYLMNQSYPLKELADALMSYNRLLGASQKTFENIQRLAKGEAVVVITGQQAGVLTGPLYTIYKALTVIQLADRLTMRGISTVPVFWIASEDHDFYEISRIYFLNRDHEEIEVRLTGEVYRQPIGKLNMQNEIQQFLNQFEKKSPDTEFKPEMIEKLKEMAKESTDLAQWFGRIMTWLLKDTGIIFVDALDPELRRLGKEFFFQVLKKSNQITVLLKDAGKRLIQAGYPVQIQKNDDQVHLFLIEEDARYPLEKIDGGYQLRGKDRVYSIEEIKTWIEKQPETVSTNVVTRPLLQDLLFPTIAYVGGPGEIAYFAQYRKIYSLFDMEMPIIYPRVSMTLIENTIFRSLKKYDIRPIDVFVRFDEIRDKHLSEVDQLNIKAKFNLIKKKFIPEYQKLIKDLQQLDSKFKKLGSDNLKRIIDEINYLENKALHQHRKNSEILLRRLDKIEMNMYPNGNFQERRFNIFPYLFKYQQTLIQELLKLDLLSFNCHYLIYL